MSIDFFSLAWKITFPGKPLKKLVLLSLADHYNNNVGFAWPSYETIATRCGVDRRTVIRVVAELEADGFVTREKRHKTGRLRTSNAYKLNEKLMRSAAGLSEGVPGGKSSSSQEVTTYHSNGDTGSPLMLAVYHPNSDTGSPLLSMVTEDHHDSDTGSPSIVTDDHHDGDRRSPELFIDPLSEPLEEPLSTTAADAGDYAADDAGIGSAEPLAPILNWIAFDDALTNSERAALDPASLLAWAYWVHLERDRRGSQINNPVGLVRARWRRGQLPRDDLLALARGWLALDDEGRGRLLGHLEWAADNGFREDYFDGGAFNLPAPTAWSVYQAAGGVLGPPSLMPPAGAVAWEPPEKREEEPSGPGTLAAYSAIWQKALVELEMQMTRATFSAWLRGTTARENGDGLTVYVRNEFAKGWLENRLMPVIQRTVDGLASSPVPVRFALTGGDHEAV